jgi:hypothetical protein
MFAFAAWAVALFRRFSRIGHFDYFRPFDEIREPFPRCGNSLIPTLCLRIISALSLTVCFFRSPSAI